MLKKIIYIIISVAIVVFGIIGFDKLNYWDRSVRIFEMGESQPFGRGMDRSGSNIPEGEARFPRPEMTQSPDSLRRNFQFNERPFVNPDSTTQRFSRDQFQRERIGPPGNENFRGRGGFSRGTSVRLRNVTWFLAVFSMFAVITIYFDRTIEKLHSKKKNSKKNI